MNSTNNQKIMQKAKFLNLQDESKLGHHDDSEEKISVDNKLKDDMKSREQEQMQELLIGLTNELFDKVEKISAKKKSYPRKTIKVKSESKKTISTDVESKIVFTDLSWYREKLASDVEKTKES